MSYAVLRARARRGLGEDPHPLCTDPNQYKDSATCSETACKQGYAATVTGDCVLIAATGAGGAVSSAAPSICDAANGTWDASRGQCVQPAEQSGDEGWGTRLFGGESADSPSPDSGFDSGAPKSSLASLTKDAAPWVLGVAAGIGLLAFFARPA